MEIIEEGIVYIIVENNIALWSAIRKEKRVSKKKHNEVTFQLFVSWYTSRTVLKLAKSFLDNGWYRRDQSFSFSPLLFKMSIASVNVGNTYDREDKRS